MKKVFVIAVLFIFVQQLWAQTADDALRMSQTYYEGTARSMAMGGSFGALGADFSTASTNPAGIGLFRKSQYSFSPVINTNKTKSLYNGTWGTDEKTNANFSNLGYVYVNQKGSDNNSGVKYFQFAVGMNRLNSFHTNLTMGGPNDYNSKLDVYLENANGVPYSDIENNVNNNYSFDLNPAWQLYLIDTIPGYQNQYYSPVPFGGTFQQEQVRSRGSVDEWYFAFATNINNVLYLGATIGLPNLNYYSDSYYSETDVADTIPYFNSWELDQTLQTKGIGINIKLGAIVQITKWFRLGVAYHSPTYYWSLEDNWYTTTYADLEWADPQKVSSPTGTYDYNLKTPSKLLADAGIILFNRGSISAEYERVNYANMKLGSDQYQFDTENSDIKQYYHSTSNIRLGTEWRFGAIDLRGGYAIYGSPYARNYNDGKSESISGGIGFHLGDYTLDLAYVHSRKKQDYYLYGTNDITVNPVHNTFTNNTFVASLSFSF